MKDPIKFSEVQEKINILNNISNELQEWLHDSIIRNLTMILKLTVAKRIDFMEPYTMSIASIDAIKLNGNSIEAHLMIPDGWVPLSKAVNNAYLAYFHAYVVSQIIPHEES